MKIALDTVKSHVKAVLEKLAAGSRTQGVATAHQRGLIDQGHALATSAGIAGGSAH